MRLCRGGLFPVYLISAPSMGAAYTVLDPIINRLPFFFLGSSHRSKQIFALAIWLVTETHSF